MEEEAPASNAAEKDGNLVKEEGGMGLVFRWDPCGLACCVLTYGAVIYAAYVVSVWLIVPSFPNSAWSVVHIGLFGLLLVLITASHTRAMLSDPGIVPFPRTQLDFSDLRRGRRPREGREDDDSESPDSESETEAQKRRFVVHTFSIQQQWMLWRRSVQGEDWTVCGRCEAYRPPRAHHCRICKRCVRKMDHHCPWINNCVGEYNQKYFLLFLFYVGVAAFYAITLVLLCWAFPPKEQKEEFKQQRLLHTIFLTIESTLFMLFVIAVGCDQVQAIWNDETAVEQVPPTFSTFFAYLVEIPTNASRCSEEDPIGQQNPNTLFSKKSVDLVQCSCGCSPVTACRREGTLSIFLLTILFEPQFVFLGLCLACPAKLTDSIHRLLLK